MSLLDDHLANRFFRSRISAADFRISARVSTGFASPSHRRHYYQLLFSFKKGVILQIRK